jgi:hypothetical protein
MSITAHRGKAALAGLLAATAIGSAAPAQAHHPSRPIDCDARLERLESQFRKVEARFGYDVASRWWNDVAWPRFYRHCPNT